MMKLILDCAASIDAAVLMSARGHRDPAPEESCCGHLKANRQWTGSQTVPRSYRLGHWHTHAGIANSRPGDNFGFRMQEGLARTSLQVTQVCREV